MSNVIVKTYELIDELEKSNTINNLIKTRNELLLDDILLDKIKKIKDENNNNKLILMRKEIYKNKIYRKYMDCYNELLYMVIDINNKIKNLIESRDCHNESN